MKHLIHKVNNHFRVSRFAIFFVLVSLLCPSLARSELVDRRECFPIERLPMRLRPLASKILKKALDSEALYTITIAMKPMSSDFISVSADNSTSSKQKVDDIAQILKAFRCGKTIQAELIEFKNRFEGKTYYSPIIYNRVAFDQLMLRESAFFSRLGDIYDEDGRIDFRKTVLAVENSQPPVRFRGYGLLFGYPKEAVDFFVKLYRKKLKTNRYVKREFISIPTFSSRDGNFVWAVPDSSVVTRLERQMRDTAYTILHEYSRRRSSATEGRSSVQLIRNWFSIGNGICDTDKPRWNKDGSQLQLPYQKCARLLQR